MSHYNNNALSLICGIIALILLSSCTTAKNITQTQDIHMIMNVPFYPQEEYQCGPASLASVLNYWNASVTYEEVADAIFSKSARGTLTVDMILYAKEKGLHAEQFRGSMERVRHSVDSGHPLIVLVDYGFSVIQVNHFMVVNGYTEDGVIVHSGNAAKKFLQEKDFLTAWKKTGYWTLLIRRP